MNHQEEKLFNKIMLSIKHTKQKEPFFKMINFFSILPNYTKLATALALIFGLSFGYFYNNTSNLDQSTKTCTYIDTITDPSCMYYW